MKTVFVYKLSLLQLILIYVVFIPGVLLYFVVPKLFEDAKEEYRSSCIAAGGTLKPNSWNGRENCWDGTRFFSVKTGETLTGQ